MATRKPANAGRSLPPESVTPAMFQALLEATGDGCSRRSAWARCALGLAFYGGLRSAEVLALAPADMDRDRALIHVRNGKGAKPRAIPLDAELVPHLDAWARVRGEHGPQAPLLCASSGKPVNTSHLRRLVHRLAERAGVASARGLHPHALRHGAARRWAHAGVSLHVVSAMLGHSSLGVTAAYLSRVTPEESARALERAGIGVAGGKRDAA